MSEIPADQLFYSPSLLDGDLRVLRSAILISSVTNGRNRFGCLGEFVEPHCSVQSLSSVPRVINLLFFRAAKRCTGGLFQGFFCLK